MAFQFRILLIGQQHRRRPSSMSSHHIVDRVAHLCRLSNKPWLPSLIYLPCVRMYVESETTYHNQPLPSILQPPRPRNMQNPRRIRLGRSKLPRHNGRKGLAREELLQQMHHGTTESYPIFQHSPSHREKKVSHGIKAAGCREIETCSKFRVHRPMRTPRLSR